MSDRTTVSFRCSEALSDLLSEVSDELSVSKSGLIRETLSERLSAEDLEDLDIPEHLLIEAERERIKRENRVDDLRGGFEGRVLDQFERRFAREYRPDDMRSLAQGYVSEAKLLFSDEREAEAVSYVNSLMERYAEMWDERDRDGLDPSEAFGQVDAEPETSPEMLQQVREDARKRLRETVGGRSDSDMARALAKQHGVPEQDALRVIRDARSVEAQGGAADD